MTERTGEDIVLDFDGWLGKQDEETRNGIQQHLNVVPEAGRALEKQRLASMFALSEATGLDLGTVNERWDTVRGGYAEQQGGDWLSVKDDEAKFFGRLQQHVTQQRDERHLLFGLDDEKDPKAKDAWQSSLSFRAQEAAYAGKSYADALIEWDEKAKGKPGYETGRLSEYADLAARTHKEMSDKVAKVRPIAEQAFGEMSRYRDSDNGNAAPFSLFRGLSSEEKQLAFRLMTDKAGKGSDKSRTQAFFEAVGRGFENLAIGGGSAALRSRLLERQFKAGDVVTAANPADQVAAEFMQESLARQSGGIGSGAGGLARAMQGGRTLTEEEARAWNKQLPDALEDLDTAEQLRKFGQQVVDPAKAGDAFFQKLVLPVADSTALMSSLMIPGSWAPALELGARSYQNDEYARLREAGMDAGQANKLSAISGTAQAALDKLEFGVLARGVPGTKRVLQQFAFRGSTAARFGLNFGSTLAAETTIELIQDHVIPALVQDNLTSDPRFDIQWADVWSDAAKAAPETALGMVLLSGLGGIAQTRGQSAYVRELSGSRAAMRFSGYTLEQIEEIQSAPVEQRGDLLAKYLPEKAPTGEAQKSLVSEVATLAKEEQAAFEARKAAETAATSEAADYAIRVTRTGEGWQVTKEDGATVTVDTAEAAQRIREDLRQAATQQEAEALVAIIDTWHGKAGADTTRQTTLTGETVRSDGDTITATRDGEVVREIKNPKDLATLREEARMDAAAGGFGDIDVLVNGSNVVEFGERVADGARTVVQRLELNQSESTALTAIHEQVEAVWRTGMKNGTITQEETQKAVASIAAALDPATARDAEERAFRERVQKVARGEGSETELRETVSELVVAEVLGRRKDGTSMPAGTVTTALDAAINAATDAGEVKALGKFRAFLRAARQYFRAVLGTVAALKKAKREGKGADFDALVNKLLGLDEQAAHQQAVADEAEAIANESELEYTPPTEEEMAAGVAFSTSPVRVGNWTQLERKSFARKMLLEEKGGKRWTWLKEQSEKTDVPSQEQQLRDWAESVDLTYSEASEIRRLKPDDLFDGLDEIIPEADVLLTEPESDQFINLAKQDEWTPEEKAELDQLLRKIKAGLSAGRKLWEKIQAEEEEAETEDDGPAQMEMGFRVATGKRLELVQKRLDAALARNPSARRDLAKKADRNLQKLAFEWSTERWTPYGDLVRPVVEQRSKAELDKEQAFRQAKRADELATEGIAKLSESAIRALEQGFERLEDRPLIATMLGDHGKLISKATAARRGQYGEYDGAPWLPPKFYAGYGMGGLMPDEMAQALYESGLLREPSPDALWDALDREVKSARSANEAFREASTAVKEIERQARNQAREEAAEWRREQDELQRKDWNPRARLLRDMRTLDAILSVMPAEVRGKVGGFIKLATLGSDEARAEEIGRRIDKLSILLENHLQDELTEAMFELLEKAQPEREPGKVSRGKIGAEAHRYFDEVAAVMGLSEDEVEQRRAGIAKAYEAPDLTTEKALELFEREQILDTFGAWEKKSAADMDAALKMAQEVYHTGRNKRRMIEEARLAEVAQMAEQVVAALGSDSYKDIQGQKGAAHGLKSKAGNLALDLKSFGEVLEALLGREHPLAKKWTRAAREGFAKRNDEIRELRKRWKEALEKATGKKGVEARRALWDMGREQTIEAENAGKQKGGAETVPIRLIDQWKAGTANPESLGLTPEEAEMLIADRDAMEPEDRREALPLTRTSREGAGKVPMTEAEGIFLTMLGAQKQYSEALDKAGWTSDALASIEKQLSPAAKKLRKFMREEYKEGYGPLAAIFEHMYGVALPQIKNYAPASFYHTGLERETTPTEGGGLATGMRAGFLRNRKKHRAMPRLENAFATFFGHANQTAHWKGLAEFVREFSGVLGKPEVKMAIEARHGAHMLKTLNDWVRNLEGNGLQVQSGMLDKAVSWLTSAQSYIALSFRLGTLFKQSSALLGSAYRIPLNEYARGFGKLVTGQLDVGKVFSSPVIQRRLETGFAPEVRAAMNDIWTAKPTRRAAILERGMELIGLTDAIFTTGSAAIAYDYHLREAQKAGLDGAAAEAVAMREVDEIVSRTAQPADVVDRSLFEARLNSFGRLLFMFASEARQKSSLWLTAWQNTLTGKATSDDVRVLVLSHLIVGPMMQAITSAWRDARNDDDDEWLDTENWNPLDFLKAIVAGPLSGIPLIGDALSGFNNDGVLSRNKLSVQSLKQLFEGPKEREAEKVEWYVKRITRVMQGVDSFTGVTGSVIDQTFSLLDNLSSDEDEQAKQERARIRRERKEAKEDE